MLKVNQPVMIPGRVLQPGEYVLKLAPHTLSNRQIVQVFNSDETQLLDTVIAIPRARTTAAAGTQFTFWEMAAGQPPALRTWYFPGDNIGHEFTYPKDVTQKIAQYNPNKRPAFAEEAYSLEDAKMGSVTPAGEFRAQAAGTTATAQVQPPPMQPRTDSQAYAPMGCPPAARQPTVTAQVLPPYPIAAAPAVTAQPEAACPPPPAPPVQPTVTAPSVQPEAVQPAQCPPTPGVQPPPAQAPITAQPQVVQPVAPQPLPPVQPQPAQPPPCECPPSAAITQPGVTVQPRTDETNIQVQPQEAQPVQPVAPYTACPPVTTTQPGATVQPRTDETNVTVQPQQAQPSAQPSQPCVCPESPAQFQNNTDSNTAATPMVSHMCC